MDLNKFKDKRTYRIEGDRVFSVNSGLEIIPTTKLFEIIDDLLEEQPLTVRGVYDELRQKYHNVTIRSIRDYFRFNVEHQIRLPPKRKTTSIAVDTKAPFNVLQIDLTGIPAAWKLPPTIRRKSMLAIVIDIYSRYVEAEVIRDKSADTVTEALKTMLERLPMKPRAIQSDNGKEFQGVFKEYLQDNNIKQIHSAAYTPQSQGKVERFNGTIKRAIGAFLERTGEVFTRDVLADFVASYNNTRHSSTGTVPAEAILKNTIRPKVRVTPEPEFKVGDYVRILVDKELFEKAATWSEDVYEVKKVYNNRSTERPYYRIENDEEYFPRVPEFKLLISYIPPNIDTMEKTNSWIEHVREFSEANGIPYKDAMKEAKKTWEGGSSVKVKSAAVTPVAISTKPTWKEHVAQVRAARPDLKYKEAVKEASKTWKKMKPKKKTGLKVKSSDVMQKVGLDDNEIMQMLYASFDPESLQTDTFVKLFKRLRDDRNLLNRISSAQDQKGALFTAASSIMNDISHELVDKKTRLEAIDEKKRTANQKKELNQTLNRIKEVKIMSASLGQIEPELGTHLFENLVDGAKQQKLKTERDMKQERIKAKEDEKARNKLLSDVRTAVSNIVMVRKIKGKNDVVIPGHWNKDWTGGDRDLALKEIRNRLAHFDTKNHPLTSDYIDALEHIDNQYTDAHIQKKFDELGAIMMKINSDDIIDKTTTKSKADEIAKRAENVADNRTPAISVGNSDDEEDAELRKAMNAVVEKAKLAKTLQKADNAIDAIDKVLPKRRTRSSAKNRAATPEVIKKADNAINAIDRALQPSKMRQPTAYMLPPVGDDASNPIEIDDEDGSGATKKWINKWLKDNNAQSKKKTAVKVIKGKN